MSSGDGLTLETLIARAEISDVVHRYATGVDRRDWVLYRSIFADEADFDFTTWSGGEPRRLAADQWVAGVRDALSGFDATHHLSSNHVHTIEGETATCVSYMAARHYLVDAGGRRMQSLGGFYANRLRRTAGGWKIEACKLTVTWEVGDRGLFQIAARRWAENEGRSA
jgi:hypothetical protein